MDNDVDAFSIDIGDPDNALALLLDRDTEVRSAIFLQDSRLVLTQQFTGVADTTTKTSDDMTLSIVGRDFSSIALSDAKPGKFKQMKPKQFITDRAKKLGMPIARIAPMSEIGLLATDGSETEWALWYRIARKKGMWMWTLPTGGLVIDKLHYSINPSYFFGHPMPNTPSGWLMPSQVTITKSTVGRVGEVWVYGEDQKTNLGFASRQIDPHIKSWKRLPLRILTSQTAKSISDASDEAKIEVFESIVGSYEIELVFQDTGQLVNQDSMVRLNIPELEIEGLFYVVGVRKQGGMDGMQQVVRVRQKGFALSKRVPDDPKLKKSADAQAVPGSVAAALSSIGDGQGVRWAESFVRAAREFGSAKGWDLSVFLGVLLAVAQKEGGGFRNVREGGDYEWQPYEQFQNDPRNSTPQRDAVTYRKYETMFANKQKNPDNPRYPASESGVGPMQLTTPIYKTWADQYGWNGKASADEFAGGRWNPDSNIRAGARALADKLAIPPQANPNDPNTIWIGVRRYHGSPDSAENDAYMKDVKQRYDNFFKSMAEGAVAAATKLPAGSQTNIPIPNHGTLQLPDNTPLEIRKAINWCLRRLGDPYVRGGSGPYYDCSSFVSAALAQGSAALATVLDEPSPGSHGESTYTLFRQGRFPFVFKNVLKPGDLCFFDHGGHTPEHVGMYLGEGLMIHDSHPGANGGVKVSGLSEDWFRDHYMGARRLVKWFYQGDNNHGE